MTTYTIKPLTWSEVGTDGTLVAETVIGWMFVRPYREWWEWSLGNSCAICCQSKSLAQAKAESYYRDRLLAALDKVDPK